MKENEEDDNLDLFPDFMEEPDSSLNLEDTPDNKKENLEKELEDFKAEDNDDILDENSNNTSLEGNTSSPSVATSLALALREKGVLTTIEEEKINAFKEVEELIDALVLDRQNSTDKELNDAQKKYIEALRTGVPEEEIKQDLAAEEAYNSLKEEDLEENANLQQQVYYNDLLSNGIAPEKAKKIVTNAVNTGTLLEDSKESLVSLQTKSKTMLSEKIAKAKKEKEDYINEQKEKVSKLKDDILKMDEFAGIKLNEAQKLQVFENLTKVVGMEGDTPLNTIASDRKKNPEDFEKRQALFYTLTNGFKDLTSIETKKRTSAVVTLKEQLSKQDTKYGNAHKAPLSTSASEFLKHLKKEEIK